MIQRWVVPKSGMNCIQSARGVGRLKDSSVAGTRHHLWTRAGATLPRKDPVWAIYIRQGLYDSWRRFCSLKPSCKHLATWNNSAGMQSKCSNVSSALPCRPRSRDALWLLAETANKPDDDRNWRDQLHSAHVSHFRARRTFAIKFCRYGEMARSNISTFQPAVLQQASIDREKWGDRTIHMSERNWLSARWCNDWQLFHWDWILTSVN